MVNIDKIKGLIVSKGMKQKQVYEAMGLTRRQWTSRMATKKLDSDDMYKLTKILGDEVVEAFFEDLKVT